MQDTLTEKQLILDALLQDGYQAENYTLGIRVYLNRTRRLQYVDISRLPNHELSLDVYTKGKLDPNSLELLEDHGRIRSDSLLRVLNQVEDNFL